MSKCARTKLVPQSMKPPKRQNLEAIEIGPSLSEQKENPSLSELDMEIECPRCNDIMELNSGFDALMYSCENCSFLLKYV